MIIIIKFFLFLAIIRKKWSAIRFSSENELFFHANGQTQSWRHREGGGGEWDAFTSQCSIFFFWIVSRNEFIMIYCIHLQYAFEINRFVRVIVPPLPIAFHVSRLKAFIYRHREHCLRCKSDERKTKRNEIGTFEKIYFYGIIVRNGCLQTSATEVNGKQARKRKKRNM